MTTGRIKFFDDARGFAFIENDETTERDVFVHIKSLTGRARDDADTGVDLEGRR
jgi:cold shock CspA family protein